MSDTNITFTFAADTADVQAALDRIVATVRQAVSTMNTELGKLRSTLEAVFALDGLPLADTLKALADNLTSASEAATVLADKMGSTQQAVVQLQEVFAEGIQINIEPIRQFAEEAQTLLEKVGKSIEQVKEEAGQGGKPGGEKPGAEPNAGEGSKPDDKKKEEKSSLHQFGAKLEKVAKEQNKGVKDGKQTGAEAWHNFLKAIRPAARDTIGVSVMKDAATLLSQFAQRYFPETESKGKLFELEDEIDKLEGEVAHAREVQDAGLAEKEAKLQQRYEARKALKQKIEAEDKAKKEADEKARKAGKIIVDPPSMTNFAKEFEKAFHDGMDEMVAKGLSFKQAMNNIRRDIQLSFFTTLIMPLIKQVLATIFELVGKIRKAFTPASFKEKPEEEKKDEGKKEDAKPAEPSKVETPTPSVPAPATPPATPPAQEQPAAGAVGKQRSKHETRLDYWQEELSEQLQASGEKDFKKRLEMELQFWQQRQKLARAGSAEYGAIQLALDNIRARQEQAAQDASIKLATDAITQKRDLAIKAVDEDEATAKKSLEKKRISNEQFLEIEIELEERRRGIKQKALDDERAMLEEKGALTIEAQMRLDKQLEELALESRKKQKEYEEQLEAERPSMVRVMDQTEQSLQKNLAAMLDKTQTFKEAMRNVWGDMRKAFVNEYIKPTLREFLSHLKTKLMALLGFKEADVGSTAAGTAAKGSIEKMGAANSMATNASGVIGNIMNNAVEAMSGAFKAIVGIPFVGPILAVGAGAAAFAAVKGMVGKVKSASGGYDIPRGTNPLTQLHEEEMVLPKPYANVIRDMAGQGEGAGAAASGGQYHINIQALDARGVRQLFMEHGSAMVASLRAQGRNFAGA
ncbi:hypothetical protein [Leeia aquatica]|uniref:Uncharacterized protein n=1 Tax=Leeia aquatica TaxID=2725557 RepID=A0A847S9E8_9NEIS|nr:hypothetical protein [Leeia aquatica]NLR74206.1 hypothetical protein [Leeia aquatica]